MDVDGISSTWSEMRNIKVQVCYIVSLWSDSWLRLCENPRLRSVGLFWKYHCSCWNWGTSFRCFREKPERQHMATTGLRLRKWVRMSKTKTYQTSTMQAKTKQQPMTIIFAPCHAMPKKRQTIHNICYKFWRYPHKLHKHTSNCGMNWFEDRGSFHRL